MIITGLILLIMYIIKKFRKQSDSGKSISSLPGPKGYPIIGNLLEFIVDSETAFKGRHERALKYAPIYQISMLNRAIVGICNPEDMELILSNMKHITKGRVYESLHNWLGMGLLTSSGSQWQTRRKILTPAFHFNILQEFLGIFNRETDNLVAVLKNRCREPYIDVVKPITEFTLYSIGETAMGVNFNNHEKCKDYKKAVYRFGELFIYKAARPWLRLEFIYDLFSNGQEEKQVIKTLHAFSTNAITERKKQLMKQKIDSYSAKKRLALLDIMLNAQNVENSNIQDNDIREEVDTFVFEGHDTTSVSLCYTLMVLANRPEVQDEIYQEIVDVIDTNKKHPDLSDLANLKYMERCIKESLRLYPSVPVITRILGEDVVTHTGYLLPKNTEMSLLIYSMHHNPKLWDDPEKFNPDRFLPESIALRHPFTYIPFSAGPRNCIGQRFALLELKTALCGILRSFQLQAVDKPEDMRFKMDMVLRPATEIKVKFLPRTHN